MKGIFGAGKLLSLGQAARWIATLAEHLPRWCQRGEDRRKATAGCDPNEVGAPGEEAHSPTNLDGLVRRLLKQERYALLLRPQIAARLQPEHVRQALEQLRQKMSLIPEGEVILGRTREPSAWQDFTELDESYLVVGQPVFVPRCYIDRYAVTNRQYQQFVAAGGYEEPSLWDEAIWPAVCQFTDQTGRPGPRFWRHGTFEAGKEHHPVVGVNWYEARAYARWVGKRLPTDAQWAKAACWPMRLPDGTRVQRRWPWGETSENTRANTWHARRGGTMPVDAFPEGQTVGGVFQMVGNVWEWTEDDFTGVGFPQPSVLTEVPMKSIRGGAFDTYFPSQADCYFQSAELPLARKPNIGFRLAVFAEELWAEDQGTEDLATRGSLPSTEGSVRAGSADNSAISRTISRTITIASGE